MSSSLVMGGFDLLDPASPVFLALGFDRGAPVPTVSEIASSVLDGASVTGRAAANRKVNLPLLVRGVDRLSIAATTNQVLQLADSASWQLTFTPDGGRPVVYDCYRAVSTITSDLVQDAQGWQALLVQCEALPYGKSPNMETVTLAGTSVVIEGFNANPIPVTATATTGTVTGSPRVTTPVSEGAAALEVDYNSAPSVLSLTNSAAVSIPVTFPPSVVSVQVRVPAAAAITTTGSWSLTLTTTGPTGTYTAAQSSGGTPGNNVWASVTFDMSAVPVGATITGWTLQTSTINQTAATGGTTTTFNYTGAVTTYTVPAGVRALRFDLKGAGGAPGPYGGVGGRLQGVLAVTPGDVLYLRAGGAGGLPPSGTATGGAGGFGGGKYGGTGSAAGYGGHGGGGGSTIRLNTDAQANTVAAAGGGGGEGRGYGSHGGAGGGLVGGDGATNSPFGSGAGFGGSQNAGGGGGYGNGYGAAGAAGGAYNGGAGGATTNGYGGGGGGGGYYGGGGGGGGAASYTSGGGGGGSGYAATSVTGAVHTQGGGAAGQTNGSITVTYTTTEKIYFDDLRMYPSTPAGVSDTYGGVYLLQGVRGTARTPINVAVTKAVGGTFSSWIVHTPPVTALAAQPLIPLAGGASGVAYTTTSTVRYDGTYSVWLANNTYSTAVSRTWTVTITQSAPSGGPSATVSVTLTPTAPNQLIKLGEITLPLTGYPPEGSVTTTVTVTSTVAADTFNDVLLLDTRGQSVIVDSTAPAQSAGWIDERNPTQSFGGVWTGTDRTVATSVARSLGAADSLIQNPGDSQILLYGATGALAATVTYAPRWLQEAT